LTPLQLPASRATTLVPWVQVTADAQEGPAATVKATVQATPLVPAME
jgi:hypothetical protein